MRYIVFHTDAVFIWYPKIGTRSGISYKYMGPLLGDEFFYDGIFTSFDGEVCRRKLPMFFLACDERS